MAIPRFFIRNYFSFFLVILRFSVPVSDKDIFLITSIIPNWTNQLLRSLMLQIKAVEYTPAELP